MNKTCSQPLTLYINNYLNVLDGPHTLQDQDPIQGRIFSSFFLIVEDTKMLSNFNGKQNLSTVKGLLAHFMES